MGSILPGINVKSYNMSCCSVDMSIINFLKCLHLYFTYFFLLLVNIPVINKSVCNALKSHIGESSIIFYLPKKMSECEGVYTYTDVLYIYKHIE